MVLEPADLIEAERAERDDLEGDRDELREVLQHAYRSLRASISDIHEFQSVLRPNVAQKVDERLARIRRRIGWDPYEVQRGPVEERASTEQPSIEALLGRHYSSASGIETLRGEVDELKEAVSDAHGSLFFELSDVSDWMRLVAPKGTPYLGMLTDETTRQDVSEAWLEAAEVLGVEVVAPYALETENGTLNALALLVGLEGTEGTLLLDLNDFYHWLGRTPASYHVMGVRPETYRTFDRDVFKHLLDGLKRYDENPAIALMRVSEPLCSIDLTHAEYLPEVHAEVQNTDCAAWRLLLELIEEAADDGRQEFAPRKAMPRSFWRQIVTLPPSIGKLTAVKTLHLYGSNLIAIPPEIGQMTSLEVFTPYTSRRLHWFPYEITRCTALGKSTVSTRHLYGNSSHRMPFPALPSALPSGSRPDRCSVCKRTLSAPVDTQVWISLRVATDVLPLLVHACSDECVRALPDSAEGSVHGPHQGGRTLVQPDPRW